MRSAVFALVLLLSISAAASLEYNVTYPGEVKVGEWFKVNVSLKSDEPINITLYSYVYKGFNCVGQGWTTNKKEIHLQPYVVSYVVLEDLIKHGTEEGYYNLRVKMKYDNKTVVETYTIKVVGAKEIDAIYLYIGLVVVSLVGLYFVIRK